MTSTDLKMGTGKTAAQVGHAVLGAYKQDMDNNKLKEKVKFMSFEKEKTLKH